MATNVTYTSLITRIGAYIEKARVVGSTAYEQIPEIINYSEKAIVDELKLQGYEKTLRDFMQIGKSTYAKPDRWRETISMHIQVDGELVPVFPRGYEYVRVIWPNAAETDVPKFYADHESTHWLIGPTPAAAYPWEVKCYLLPRLLGPENQTNWLTEIGGNALLMRCLKEMALFLKKYDEVATFEAEYGKSISALSIADAKKLMDRSAERDGA